MTTQKEEINELKKEIEHQKQEVKTAEKRLKRLTDSLKLETKKQLVVALMAGFGFLIALVWRDFLQEIANWLVETSKLSGPVMMIKLYVAMIVTIFAVIGILIVTKINNGENLPNLEITKVA